MGIVSRIGRWLDTRFPERISVEEVTKSLVAYEQLGAQFTMFAAELKALRQKQDAFTTGAQSFDKELRELKDEMNKAKAVLSVMNRTRTTPVMSTSEPWKR